MTSVLSTPLEMSELYNQNRRLNTFTSRYQASMERRHTVGSNLNRHRNLSGPSTTASGGGSGFTRSALDNRALATPPPGIPGSHCNSSVGKEVYTFTQNMTTTTVLVRESSGINTSNRDIARAGSHGISSTRDLSHRKLDRSASDSEHDRLNGNHGAGGSGRGVNSSRYKTELCRPFEESGHCKYGDKCQFAHGAHELRNLTRHPKYKTERCRTYHTVGFCPYGPRCHFIHNEDERTLNKNYNQQHQRMLTAAAASTPSPAAAAAASLVAQRPSNLHGLTSLGCSFESSSSPSSNSSSPGHLSPAFAADDHLPSSSSSSLSPTSSASDSSSPRASPVFNFPASDASGVASLLTPLDVQTRQFYNNMVDIAARQFSAMLDINIKNQRAAVITFPANVLVPPPKSSLNTEDYTWADADFLSEGVGLTFPLPPVSPVSVSDESMGSTGSLSSINGDKSLPPFANLCDSPLDLGKSLRLPIFNNLNASL